MAPSQCLPNSTSRKLAPTNGTRSGKNASAPKPSVWGLNEQHPKPGHHQAEDTRLESHHDNVHSNNEDVQMRRRMSTLESSMTCILVERGTQEALGTLEAPGSRNPDISKKRKSMPATTMMVLLMRTTSRWFLRDHPDRVSNRNRNPDAANHAGPKFARSELRYILKMFATS